MIIPTSLRLPGLEPIPLSQVLYLQGAWNYTTVHLISGKQHVLACTLRTMQGRTGFLRIHKSFLVNPKHIIGLSRGTARYNGQIKLTGGKELSIARRQYESVRQQVYALQLTPGLTLPTTE
ncbi:LytR/AlgR family response regulator transcription factor [Spirosoma koreense]